MSSCVGVAPELVGDDCGEASPWMTVATVLFKPTLDLLVVVLVPELVGITAGEGSIRGCFGAADPELVGCSLSIIEVLNRLGARARAGALLG